MDIYILMREQDADDLAHCSDSYSNGDMAMDEDFPTYSEHNARRLAKRAALSGDFRSLAATRNRGELFLTGVLWSGKRVMIFGYDDSFDNPGFLTLELLQFIEWQASRLSAGTGFVVQNIVAHNPSNAFCPCPACDADLEQALASPLVMPPVLTGTATVERASLDTWRRLFADVASRLQWHYDMSGLQETEDAAVQCEQAAEQIESILESE